MMNLISKKVLVCLLLKCTIKTLIWMIIILSNFTYNIVLSIVSFPDTRFVGRGLLVG